MVTRLVQTSAQLSAHLRSLRNSRALTQAQLGALVGLAQARIAKIERNPGLVSVDQLMQILTALNAQMLLQPGPSAGNARSSKQTTEW